MQNSITYLKDYQPPGFSIISVYLDFDLYDDHVVVSNRMSLQRIHSGDLHLSGNALELISIHMNDEPLPTIYYIQHAQELVITPCADEFTLTIVTRIRPQENTAWLGLYRSNNLFCTQCEAEGFRCITYFLDRPDVLTIFTTRISADKSLNPILLSNGDLIDKGDLEGGRHWVIWHDPYKKPAYLFALIAGNLSCVADQFTTYSGKTIDLHIYVESGYENKCVHAMNSLKKAMRWDEEEYGREYDLNRFIMVVVNESNVGAMENKGLNVFTAKYFFTSPDMSTDQDYIFIEHVIAHEYFHNWTGNRIVCRDWFQVCLKEGLTCFREQEFSSDMNLRDVNRILDVIALRDNQFTEDRGIKAHPVTPEFYQAINNVYTPTAYAKGAELIRMQKILLGAAGFRRGMDLYFNRHDGQIVTIDDFISSMEDANQIDLTQFKYWYSQAGTPEVSVQTTYRLGRLTLLLTQTCPPTPECNEKKPFHIPIRFALFNPKGELLPIENDILELREAEQIVHVDGLQERPVVSFLRDFSAPVILRYDQSEDDLFTLMCFETNGFAKWNAAQTLSSSYLRQFYYSLQHIWHFPQRLIDAYRSILTDDSLDGALRAQILTPPTYEEVTATLTDIDVERVEAVRDFFNEQLSKAIFSEAMALYHDLWEKEDHAMNRTAYSRRSLRNVCLKIMMDANEELAIPLCRKQYSLARTMSDQIASFTLLVNSRNVQVRRFIIDDFYSQWQANGLVLNKWFAAQASSKRAGTLSQVQALLLHPRFNLKNANKLHAVVGAFCQTNPRYFHAVDGSGYAFLVSILIELDKVNPQLAVIRALPFTRGQCLDAVRRKHMKQQLQRLLEFNLSCELYDVIYRHSLEL